MPPHSLGNAGALLSFYLFIELNSSEHNVDECGQVIDVDHVIVVHVKALEVVIGSFLTDGNHTQQDVDHQCHVVNIDQSIAIGVALDDFFNIVHLHFTQQHRGHVLGQFQVGSVEPGGVGDHVGAFFLGEKAQAALFVDAQGKVMGRSRG